MWKSGEEVKASTAAGANGGPVRRPVTKGTPRAINVGVACGKIAREVADGTRFDEKTAAEETVGALEVQLTKSAGLRGLRPALQF